VSQDQIELLDRLRHFYEVHDFEHALAILSKDFPEEFFSLLNTLLRIKIGKSMILQPGGSESQIPRLFSTHLVSAGWEKEVKIKAALVADGHEVAQDTHYIDYVKGRVALDIEWNSKDQTFDRDLFALRTFHDFDRISVGILITRGSEFAQYFRSLDEELGLRKVSPKYGASTTHIAKLIPRIKANRHGKCPLFVLGMRPSLVDESL
jgi:CRISPR-associated protein Csd2